MDRIYKLDEKYLVIKIEDLDAYFSQFTKWIFTTDDEQKYIDSLTFKNVLAGVQEHRRHFNKQDNSYVVLNLVDKIDIIYLLKGLENIANKTRTVNDIAVLLVNAIIKAKTNGKE